MVIAAGESGMSVINKMLRDLDHRQTLEAQAKAVRPVRTGLAAGTSVVAGQAGAPVGRWGSWRQRTGVSVLLIPLLTVGVAWQLGWFGVAKTAAPGGAKADHGDVVGPAIAPAVSAPFMAIAPVIPSSIAINIEAKSVQKVAPARIQATAQSAAVLATVAAKVVPAKAAGIPLIPASAAIFNAPVLPKNAASASQIAKLEPQKSEQQVAMDVLAQAQVLWNQSEHATALALVQTAIGHLDQLPTRDNNAAMAALAREHTRMVLAQGQATQALAMLVRLEPRLANWSDIWALRGNLSQRLGLHPAAVQAYLKALDLRPHEPRWMLGAAVSLAVQGQLGEAAQWVEKARLAGGLSPDVANYLRQLGVQIRSD